MPAWILPAFAATQPATVSGTIAEITTLYCCYRDLLQLWWTGSGGRGVGYCGMNKTGPSQPFGNFCGTCTNIQTDSNVPGFFFWGGVRAQAECPADRQAVHMGDRAAGKFQKGLWESINEMVQEGRAMGGTYLGRYLIMPSLCRRPQATRQTPCPSLYCE